MPADAPGPGLVERLRAFEDEARRSTRFAAQRPWSAVSGSDPWALAQTAAGDLAILWRGDGKLTLAAGRAFDVPVGARDLVARDDALLTAAQDTLVVWRPAGVERRALPGALELTSADAAPGLGVRYAVDALLDRLFVVHKSGEVLARFPTCRGPEEVRWTKRGVLVRCVLDHRVQRFDLDELQHPRPGPETVVQHDGPVWAMRALADGRLLVAGVEDEPLDRTIGSFGNVDSFLWLYDGERRSALNLGAHGVITPRSIARRPGGGALEILVGGPGGPWLARVRVDAGGELAFVARQAVAPGVVDVIETEAGPIVANPLLDRVRRAEGADIATGRAPDDVDVRVGEALFFTHLMAPAQSSEGKLSRFTCETCHLEGGVDGRVHHTGRGEVRVSTKTLRGLFNNRPHFSRALDESLAKMVHNEFRVAHANTEADPLGSRTLEDHPWLRDLGVSRDLEAEELRRALMRFLMVFQHEGNPRVRGRSAFNDVERAGAELFRDKCARCHSARAVADDPASEVPFTSWEAHVFGAGNLVFGRDGYEKTGVTPYVHAEGARPPSLRRVTRKWPLLTSGAAANLQEVLRLAGVAEGRFFHAGAPAGSARLSAGEREALRAFLELL
jgi:cytochrome c peroxidase